MTRRGSRSQIDQLIAESRQITRDLQALRGDLERSSSDRVYGGWKDRADLIYGNLQRMTDEMFKLRYPESAIDSEDVPDFSAPRPRALGKGQFYLTSGGR